MSNYMMAVFVEQVTRILDSHIISDVAKTEAIEAMCQGWKAVDIQESRSCMGIYSFLNRSAKKDERITELEAQVIRLTDQNTDISERLDMAHEVETSQAEVIATQKQTIADLQADVREIAVASDRYVKDIAQLQGECLVIAAENSDLVAFVRQCVAGSGIRADKPGGAKLMEQARVLLKQYDSPNDKQVVSE